MSESGIEESRPMSTISTRIPSQAGIRATFSRPITAVEKEGTPLTDWEDDDALIDDVLITELKEALQDTPLPAYIRFQRCEDLKASNELADIHNSEEWDTDLDDDNDSGDADEDSSFRQLYLDICEKLRVTPVSYFARHIEDSVVSLHHHGLSASEATAIARSLKKILRIEKLDLEGNWVKNSGCRHLCQVLEENQTIKALSIAANQLSDSCVSSINSMLAHNSTLKSLSLAANLFTDNSAHEFADCLEDCKLEVFNLSGNEFGEKGGLLLGPALGTNVYMDVLDLSWNCINGAGAVAVAKGLKENVHLSVCDLSWNGFGEIGGLSLADALFVNTNLKEVDISSNRLTYPVAMRFARALAANEVLEVLKMANNPITTAGCLALVEAVNKSGTSVLRYLNVYENPVEYEFLRVVKEITSKRPDFQVYHGAILRAGNTAEDIGKPAIDIVRLSQRPVMLIHGKLTINHPNKIADWMSKHRVKSSCTTEQLSRCLKELDTTLNSKLLSEAVEKIPRNEEMKINLSAILTF